MVSTGSIDVRGVVSTSSSDVRGVVATSSTDVTRPSAATTPSAGGRACRDPGGRTWTGATSSTDVRGVVSTSSTDVRGGVSTTSTEGTGFDDLVIVVIWGVVGALVGLRRFQWAPRRT